VDITIPFITIMIISELIHTVTCVLVAAGVDLTVLGPDVESEHHLKVQTAYLTFLIDCLLLLVQEELSRASEARLIELLLAPGFQERSTCNPCQHAVSISPPVSPSSTTVEPDWEDDDDLYTDQLEYVDDGDAAENIDDQDLAFQEFLLGGRKSIISRFIGPHLSNCI
jgi:hypothetical protein